MVLFLLRVILVIVLVRALWRLLRGVLEGAGYSRAASLPHGVRLVRDPVCGTYVPQERALTAHTASGGTAFFCSEACRSAYDAQAAGAR